MPAGDKDRKPPHNLVIWVFVIIIASAYLSRPTTPSARENNASDEDRCPYTEYEVRSDGDGGFSFAIERDDEACAEYGQTTPKAEERNPKVLTLSEADLLAQERMAHWTLWIGILTGTGLIVLYITFVATRDAVEETRNIGEAQTRAYLAGLSAEYAVTDRDPLAIDLTIKNFGNSPAGIWPVSSRYVITLLYIPKGDVKKAKTAVIEQRGLTFSPGTVSAGAEAVMRVRPSLFSKPSIDYPFADEVFGASLEVVIRYSDVFKKGSTITIHISEQNEKPEIGIKRKCPLKVTTREGAPGAGRISDEKKE